MNQNRSYIYGSTYLTHLGRDSVLTPMTRVSPDPARPDFSKSAIIDSDTPTAGGHSMAVSNKAKADFKAVNSSLNCPLPTVTLRRAVASDQEFILEMLARVNRNEQADSPVLQRSDLDKSRSIVAEDNAQLVGYLRWKIRVARHPQLAMRYGEISTLCIEPEHLERNVGRDLCEEFLVECTRSAISLVRLRASSDRASISLFESLGFVEGGQVTERSALDN